MPADDDLKAYVPQMEKKFEYPNARRDDSVEYEYFGTKGGTHELSVHFLVSEVYKFMREVPTEHRENPIVITLIKDPYRWLENPDSPETKQFVEAQNAVSMPFIKECPARESMVERLTEMWDYPRYGPPFREGNRYFYFHNSGIQNQPVLFVQDNLESEPKVFFDTNALAEDGTTSMNSYAFSDDGEIFAYALSKSGSDWVTINFMKVSTGEDFGEKLERVKFTSIHWTHDNAGIFYSRYPDTMPKADGTETESVRHQKLYYHKLGTPQGEDVMVLEFPENPDWMVSARVSDCGKYLFVGVSKECRDNLVFFAELKGEITGNIDLTPILDNFEVDMNYVTNKDKKAFFYTNKWAPNYQILAVDLDAPLESNWYPLIPEHRDTLDWAAPANGDKLILCYQRDVSHRLQINSLENGEKLMEIMLPELGSITGFSSRLKHEDAFYKYESFTNPGTVFSINFSSSSEPPWTPTIFKATEVKDYDEDDYFFKQVFYRSFDGTQIPMYIIHRSDFRRNGSAPTLLYGYGGFSISLRSRFSLVYLNFIRFFNGVVAVPSIRGGGEYGQRWHDMGRLLKKQCGFDDFQAAAVYLVTKGYTIYSRVCINGYSNGGLLVAACLNQRPDLFAAGVAGVGVMDLMRFHKFTIGYAWTSDYGNPEKDGLQFKNLLMLSPLHNVSRVDRKKLGSRGYPALLLLTADHDDRVVPLHSLKLIAELQHVFGKDLKQENPLLIRVDTKAGHGGGKPTAKVIQETADIFAFMMQALDLKYYHVCPEEAENMDAAEECAYCNKAKQKT